MTSGRSSGGSRSQCSPLPRIHVVSGRARRRSIVSSGHGDQDAKSPPSRYPSAPAASASRSTSSRATRLPWMSYRTASTPHTLGSPHMKIVCLVKQVPRADAIEFDQETKALRREGVPLLLNPFDAAAVAQAVALKERNGGGGEVVAITMGPPQAEAALRTCLALGADRCIHLSDRVFALADTIGTSRTLAMAIENEGDVDLVLCGRKTTDAETWQVPPETAAFLGWPHLTSIVDSEVAGRRIRASRETDHGFETYDLNGPAVLSLAYARDADGTADGPIDVRTAADLVDDVRENDKRFG